MSALIAKSFKVEPQAWANFVKAADSYGATPAEVLRELVRHADAAMKGIESGRIQSFNGDVARLIRTECCCYVYQPLELCNSKSARRHHDWVNDYMSHGT